MPISRDELENLETDVPQKKGSSLERKAEQLFMALGYKVEKNARKRGHSGTLHEIDVLAVYSAPLHKSTVLIECKEHENSIGKEVVMKLDSIIKDIGADKGIVISSGGFTRGALSYARNLNIELWTSEHFNKEIAKLGTEEISPESINLELDETELNIFESGFIGDIKGTFRIYFKVENGSSHPFRNTHAKINLLDENGNLLDSKNQKLGTIRPETIETYIARLRTYYGKLKVEIVLFGDETEYGRQIFNYKIDKPTCFIATAAYGTPFAEEINILRNWRDQRLNKSFTGRTFIRIYYRVSPSLAKIISKSDILRLIVRKFLNPFVKKLKTDSFLLKPATPPFEKQKPQSPKPHVT